VVEEVAKGSAAEQAGLRAGDLILTWRREANPPANPKPASGEIRSPFDLAEVEVEQAPRGPVTLTGRRGSKTVEWLMRPGAWRIELLPALADATRAAHEDAKALSKAGKPAEALHRWQVAIASADSRDAAWVLLSAAKTLVGSGAMTEAERAFKQTQGRAALRRFARFWLNREWGELQRLTRQWEGALDAYRLCLDVLGPSRKESLAAAAAYNGIGVVEASRGNSRSAEEQFNRALQARERQAPGSSVVAMSLYNLGLLASNRGDLSAAERLYRRSVAVWETLSPESLEAAERLNNLGIVLWKRGDLAAAEGYHRRCLSIREKLAPESLEVAHSLTNLGIVLDQRGDLAAAEESHRRALAIKEGLAPESMDVARSLTNLGVIAHVRGDLGAARAFYRRSLAIEEKVHPEGLSVAITFGNLGSLAREGNDLEAAEQYHRRSLAIREKLAPGGLDVASSLNNLGEVAASAGDLGSADQLFRQALQIHEGLAPGSPDTASVLNNLGQLAADRGDLATAESFLLRSLAITETLCPGTSAEAETRHALGMTYRLSTKLELAADLLCKAVDSLERQKGRLGGSDEVKSSFAARYAGYYNDCASALLERQRPEHALHVIERSRARSLLAMLRERDILFAADVPPHLEHESRLIDAEYDRAQAGLSGLSPAKNAEQVERLLARLRELRAAQEDVAARVKKASPRYAALKYPEPLDLAGVRSALDPGTVLLAYSVGQYETLLFVVGSREGADGLEVVRLPVTAQTLSDGVQSFRALVQKGDSHVLQELTARGAELYDLLLRPAERAVRPGERLLISPDGPLHRLPFAALLRWEGESAPRYLAEWKPVHVVASATVYAELKRGRRDTGSSPPQLVAFGDPKYAAVDKTKAEEIANTALRSVVRGGFGFTPLPASRKEVQEIAGLYPERARTYLGAEATEEKAKAIGKEARYLHFATHGYLNERFPLDSALVLTIPEKLEEGRDNGLLQAWEVFERVRIDADLVTLSACETGLGKEMGGEGLVGLTRAFQYAGARSVLASLWTVSDESTAELMKRFYGHLKGGKAKDEALRAAQVEMIRTEGTAHPFHWAAFQLIGDWR
jgi:CHAT domain-containing protein/Tfp pilus assembly protein PilF